MTKSRLRCRLAWWLVSLSAFDLAARSFQRKPVADRILAVRLDAIGDFVLWLEAARALRTLYPPGRYHLTLLGNRRVGHARPRNRLLRRSMAARPAGVLS